MSTDHKKSSRIFEEKNIIITPQQYLIDLGSFAMKMAGQAIGIAVAWGLESPPLVLFTSAVTGALGAIAPIGTCIFNITNTPTGAGMGTCGFVGQIFTFTDMGLNGTTIFAVLFLHFALPIVLSLLFESILRKMDKIKDGDYYIGL